MKENYHKRQGRKPFFKKEKSSAGTNEKPFEKFRRDNSRKEKRKKKWDAGRGDADGISTQKQDSSKGGNQSFKKEKKPFRRWEKPSVFYKKQKEKFQTGQPAPAEGSNLVRLNKFIANSGLCSRREADQMIENGLISVNGKIITQLGTKIHPDDEVKYGGETLKREKNIYVLLNKPKDYITTVKDTHERKTVMELVKNAGSERLYPVGRLDRNTTGVLLLTNDGDLTKKLTHPKYGAKKIYHVETDKNVSYQDLKKLTEGIVLEEDGMVKADEANYAGEHLGKNEVGVVLHSGKNRVVRRMFESLGYRVNKLDRVSFAGLTKKDLQRGQWRFLTEKEVGFLKMLKAPVSSKAYPSKNQLADHKSNLQ